MNQAEIMAQMAGQAAAKMEVCTIGKVLSYDASRQTAQVQPVIQARYRGKDGSLIPQAQPVLSDVPVAWPACGGWSLVGELVAGDTVMLVVSGRSLEEWKSGQGESHAPGDVRRHALQDAIAIPMGSVGSIGEEGRADGAVVLRGEDVRLGSSAALSPVALATPVDANFAALQVLLTTLSGAADWTIAAAAIGTFLGTGWPVDTAAAKVKAE